MNDPPGDGPQPSSSSTDGRRRIVVLRNLLVMYGACAGATHLLTLLRAVAIDSAVGHAFGKTGLIFSWVIVSCIAAVLAGLAIGVAVETRSPGKWLLVLALVGLATFGGWIDWRNFADVFTSGLAYFWVAVGCSLLAVLSFRAVGEWTSRWKAPIA
jgi:hypothetical protein